MTIFEATNAIRAITRERLLYNYRDPILKKLGLVTPQPDKDIDALLTWIEKRIPMAPVENVSFAIVLDGGMLDEVVSDNPAFRGANYRVVDYDIEGVDEDQVHKVVEKTGKTAFATTRVGQVAPANIIYDELEPVVSETTPSP